MILAAIRGYWRRRGWATWHLAYLNRLDGQQFPDLHVLTGEAPARDPLEQPEAETLHNLRLWVRATAPKGAAAT